ncbi:pyridoxal 5'-phosphate synthase [Allokutzneria sp. A3M-2-11 16]|uniref:pyridoxine/pyridoxamine 5'-phosphate oxidase n=1 Tax=Allokutzneria sp. A3M-2-11 16 TaxID=2962043 RepID=UPI0020B6F986|nr:pyridoxal 5'-phosphate synthase [Allokutzneria sp. A3M-2-11 16]MCP3801674.1 pyridoxal 5'-phosphate synthase [Allokutzneria sp. A3M-2-11 16]
MLGLPSLVGPLPSFDPAVAPPAPAPLFADWLTEAVEAGVREPHAATLSTVDEHGWPSARVLILKDLKGDGWQFASSRAGRKGRELAANPWAALTFYWSSLGRQVRVRGAVSAADTDLSAADFLGRSPSARAVALLGMQGQRLADAEQVGPAVDHARARIDADPGLVFPDWTLYTLHADEVEFWQGDPDRRHTRLSYRLGDDGWTKELLWP